MGNEGVIVGAGVQGAGQGAGAGVQGPGGQGAEEAVLHQDVLIPWSCPTCPDKGYQRRAYIVNHQAKCREQMLKAQEERRLRDKERLRLQKAHGNGGGKGRKRWAARIRRNN